MVLERVVAVRVADLPRMLVRRLQPLGVLLDAGDILDPQLLGQVLHHRPRHIQRVLQEQPDGPDHADLESEAKAIVIPAPLRDQLSVLVIQEEEPLQLRLRRLLSELSVRLSLAHQIRIRPPRPDRSQAPPMIEDLSLNPSTGPDHCARRPRSTA